MVAGYRDPVRTLCIRGYLIDPMVFGQRVAPVEWTDPGTVSRAANQLLRTTRVEVCIFLDASVGNHFFLFFFFLIVRRSFRKVGS